MIDPQARGTIQAWVDAFNRRDPDAAAALYAEDAVNLQIPVGKPLEGREAIREDLRAFFRAIPDNRTLTEAVYYDPPWVILEWSGSGTFHPPGAAAGKPFRIRGCGFFEIRGGLIRNQRGYWDMRAWMEQTG